MILNNSYNIFIHTNLLKNEISTHFQIILKNIQKQITTNFIIDEFRNDGRIFLLDKTNSKKIAFIDLFTNKFKKKINLKVSVNDL